MQPFSDPLPVCAQRLDASLSASLLVRFGETLRHFVFISRSSERALVDSMQTIADQLIQSNPFQLQIIAHITAISPDMSLPFPLDDYRSVLIAELDELLAILAKCADVNSKPKVEALKSHYRALLSPLAAFCHILEDLLRFAASGSDPRAPFQAQTFSLLLSLHAEIIARLNRLETVVPRDALPVVRFQIRLLASALGTSDSKFLADIERACACLVSNRSCDGTHGPTRESRHAVVWH